MNYRAMIRLPACMLIVFASFWNCAWGQPANVDGSVADNLEQDILETLIQGEDVQPLLSKWFAQQRQGPIAKRALLPPSTNTAGTLPQALAVLKKSLQRVLVKAHDAQTLTELQHAYDQFRAADALIRARFESIAEQLETQTASAIMTRLQQARNEYGKISDQLLQIASVIHNASAADAVTKLKNALALIADLSATPPPILRTELPFRRFQPLSRTPVLVPEIEPVYLSKTLPDTEDLSAGPLNPLSETILQQARLLDHDPVRIFEFVRNEINSEWYSGAKYGAEATLKLRRGNDIDQASLLIALLRASQVPARYIHGVIELATTNVADDLSLPEAKVADALNRIGIAYTPVIQGGRMTAIQVEYTWVAAYLPYSNYRGALVDFSGPVWLPLAPAIKHYQITPARAILNEMEFSTQNLLEQYLSSPQEKEPLAQVRQEAIDYLGEDADYENQSGNKTLTPEYLQLLPNSLPFDVVAVTAEYQQLPEALQQQVRVSIQATEQADDLTLLDVTLPLAQLNQRRVTISYIPASVEDHKTVNLFGGLSNTPAYLVELRPQLKIDGRLLKVAENSLPMGSAQRLTIELIAPGGQASTSQMLTAGSYYAIAIGEGSSATPILPELDAPTEESDSEGLAARLLSHIAYSYHHRWRLSEQELAGLYGVSVLRPLPAVVIVSNSVQIEYALNQPHALNWQGVNLDAALRIVEPVSAGDDVNTTRDWFRLAGLQGSYLEQQVFQDEFLVAGISADKGLALAQQQGIQLIQLDRNNISAQLPTLSLADNVKQVLTEAVQSGYRVRVARTAVTLNAWQGAVWLIEDPGSGSTGYFISGGLAGGATTEPAENWVLDFLAQALAFPYSAEPNTDPTAVARLESIQTSDELSTIVGEQLANPLAVRAIDKGGRPVAGAKITFWVTLGGGGLGPEATDRFVTETNAAGIAQAEFRAGTSTALNPIYLKKAAQDRYNTQALLNEIEVRADETGVGLQSSLLVMAFPDEPVQLIRSSEPDTIGISGIWSDTVQVIVYDRYDNPVANVPVTFRVGAYRVLVGHPPANPQNSEFFDFRECAIPFPLLGQCGQPELTQQSSTHGDAYVGLILGNMLVTKYNYEISAPDLPTLTYEISSIDCLICDVDQIFLVSWYPVNELGENINAARMGEASKLPVPVKFLYPADNASDGSSWRSATGNVSLHTVRKIEQISDYDGDGFLDEGWIWYQQPIHPDFVANGHYEASIITSSELIPVINSSGVQYTYLNRNDVQATELNIGNGKLTDYGDGDKVPVYHYVTGLDIQITALTPERISLDQYGFSRTQLQLSYQILPADYRGHNVEIEIAKNGVPQWRLPGNSREGSGYVQFPRGLEFDIGAEYTAQLIINHGFELEIRSDSIELPIGQGIFYDWSRSVSLVQDIDLVNQRRCDRGAKFSFGLSQQARVSLKFIRIESRSGVLFEGTETVLLDNELYDKGVHELNIAPDQLSAGTYRFELHGEATRGEQQETVGGGASAYLSRRDQLPVGHTLVKGVNLWNGTLNISRNDLTLPGRGPAIDLRRSYSSANQAEAGLGFGWVHNYASHLSINSCGEIILVGSDGGGMRFVDDGQGGLRPLKGYHGSLVANPEDSSFDFYSKDGTRYHYGSASESRWRLEFIEDPNANRTTLTYDDAQQRLATVSDSAGRNLQFFYRNLYIELADEQQTPVWSGDVIDRIQGPAGLEIVFDYDELGRLISASRRQDNTEYWRENYDYADYDAEDSAYHWDDRYLLIAATDAIRNASTRYAYQSVSLDADFSGGIGFSNAFTKEIIMPEGGRTSFDYLPPSLYAEELQRQVTDGRGFTTTYNLNRYGSVTRMIDPLNHITEMRWAEDDVVMIQRIDANDTVTDYSYDKHGNLTSETVHDVTDFDGVQHDYVTLYDYWPPLGFDPPFIKNKIRSKTNPNGTVTEYSYDKQGNLLSETVVGADYQIQHTYYPNGDRKATTDANDNTTQFSYDRYGFPDQVIEPLNRVTDTDYDLRGRLIQSTDAEQNTTRYDYDGRNRRILTEYPAVDGVIDRAIVSYNDATGQYTETDAAGFSNITQTDREGRVTRIQTPLTEKVFEYDEEGNQKLESFWFGNNTLRRDITFDYDASGRLQRKTEPLGRVTTYLYDGVGNLTQETLDGPADGSGFISQITRYRYDGLNHRIEESRQLSADEWATTQTRYDGAGNVVLLRDPLQHDTQQSFDALDRLRIRTDALGKSTLYDYDGNGNKIKETRHNQPQNQIRSWHYDELNQLRKATDGEENTTQYFYDAVGNLRRIVDARSNVTEHSYDARNRKIETRIKLDRVSGLDDAITIFTYDAVDNLVSEQWSNGNLIQHQYDPLKRKIRSSDNLGELATFSYDAEGNITRETDANKNVTVRIYDDLFRLVEERLPEDRVQLYSYDPANNQLSHTNGRGHTTRFQYDPLNRLIKTIDPQPHAYEESYRYDLTNNRLSVTDRRGHTTSFEYDDLNRQIKIAAPSALGYSETFEYDAVGNRTLHIDRRGIGTKTFYDRENRAITVERDGLLIEQRSYDPVGNARFVTDANGNTTSFEYDERNLVIAENRPLAAIMRYQHDAMGDVIFEQDPENRFIEYAYDDRRRKISKTRQRGDAASETTLYDYDGNGNQTLLQYPEGNRVELIYDDADRLTEVLNAADILDLQTQYSYDHADNRLSHTDANGHTTTFVYDELNRLTLKIYPGDDPNQSVQESYQYDANGNLSEILDANQQQTRFEYDELNRLTDADYSLPAAFIPDDDPLSHIGYQYDENNNLRTVTETLATTQRITQYAYDVFDRIETVIDANGEELHYNYDANGNRDRLTDPDERVTRYEHDELNRISEVIIPSVGITTYDYYRDNRLKRISYPNNAQASYRYDDAGRLREIENSLSGALVSSFHYDYDTNNNRIEQTEIQGTLSEITTYGYDPADRLDTVFYPDQRVEYTYDRVGNRIVEQVWDANQIRIADKLYSYDERDQIISISDSEDPAQNTDYEFDANGNLIRLSRNGETTNFYYNTRNQLVLIEGTTQSSRYRYDYQGLRIQKIVGGSIVNYVYDDQSVLLQTDQNHDTISYYSYGPDRLLTLGHRNEPRQFYLFDALGSVVNLVTAEGTVQARYQYDAWGNPRLTTGRSANPFGFTGHERDAETGLYYAKARFYDPVIGRFLSEDPYQGDIDAPPSLHRYLYAYQNPTVFVDPDGRVGFLSDLVNSFADSDNYLREQAGESGTLGLLGYSALRVGLAPGSAVAGVLNSASDVVAQALPGEVFSGVADQASRDLGDRIDATVAAVSDPVRTVKNAHASAVQTTTDIFAGDRRAASDAIGFFASLPAGAKGTGLGRSRTSTNQSPSSLATGIPEEAHHRASSTNSLEAPSPNSHAADTSDTDIQVLEERADGPGTKAPMFSSVEELAELGIQANRVRPGVNGKVAIIGRGMKQIQRQRDILVEKGFDVEIFDEQIPEGVLGEYQEAKLARVGMPAMKQLEIFELNRDWAQRIRDEGYTVIDTGDPLEDFQKHGFSVHYTLEKSILFPR